MTTAASCTDVRRAISGDEPEPASPTVVRAHLEQCEACRRFLRDLGRRPSVLRRLYPPLPARLAAAILERLR